MMHGLIRLCTICNRPHKNPTLRTCLACRTKVHKRRLARVSTPEGREKELRLNRERNSRSHKRYKERLTPEQRLKDAARRAEAARLRRAAGNYSYPKMTPEQKNLHKLKQKAWRDANPEKRKQHKETERAKLNALCKEFGLSQKRYGRWMRLLFDAQVAWGVTDDTK